MTLYNTNMTQIDTQIDPTIFHQLTHNNNYIPSSSLPFPSIPFLFRTSSDVHRRRRLIQHQHLCPPQQRPRQAHQLPLTNTEIVTARKHTRTQTAFHAGHVTFQIRILQCLPYCVIIVLVKGVQVVADTAGKQEWVLRDNCDMTTQSI